MNRIKKIREKRGLTQKQLSEILILSAVSLGQGYMVAAAAVCLNQLVKQHTLAVGLKKGFEGEESEPKDHQISDKKQ